MDTFSVIITTTKKVFLPGKCLDPAASGESRAGDNLMLHSIRVAYPPTNC